MYYDKLPEGSKTRCKRCNHCLHNHPLGPDRCPVTVNDGSEAKVVEKSAATTITTLVGTQAQLFVEHQEKKPKETVLQEIRGGLEKLCELFRQL